MQCACDVHYTCTSPAISLYFVCYSHYITPITNQTILCLCVDNSMFLISKSGTCLAPTLPLSYTSCLHARREFSVSTLHELEKKIETFSDTVSAKLGCRKLEDLKPYIFGLNGVTKEKLAGIVLEMSILMCDSKIVLKSALENIDKLKSDLIETKNELIEYKSSKLKSFEEIVKPEIEIFTIE